MSFFPAYFSLDNRKILLVGGGYIALEKLEKLVNFTKEITVISKEVSDEFLAFATEHNIIIEQRAYEIGDINGFDIVIVATDTVTLHKEIYEESRSSRILVNSVDDTAYCDFIFPSYIKRGDLTIAISTSGASPALAKRLRTYIEKLIPQRIETFLQEMRVLRVTMPKGKERMRFFEEKTDKFMEKEFK
ncbi:bifunctional precorrin-2 dehydrogenase/sirohydrochlorin ferrochelatase [bacterium]|nr:bifunctional precorrin-2 dehydrogenase/sirohydrochlorin ferrochelatase [bacterium]MBU1957608.1 bifunctional precorrin-2 dehydrogenase/sirohydrochlorin ferrochelatase [bacterium]